MDHANYLIRSSAQDLDREFQAYKSMYKKIWPVIKERLVNDDILIYVHPWFGKTPTGQTVTEVLKVICSDRQKLAGWGRKNNLDTGRLKVHVTRIKGLDVPHFDFWGWRSREIFRKNRHLMVRV